MAPKLKLALKRSKSRQQGKQHPIELSLAPQVEPTSATALQELKTQEHDQCFQPKPSDDSDELDFRASKSSNVIPIVTLPDSRPQPKRPKRINAQVLSPLELDQIQLATALSKSEAPAGTMELSMVPRPKAKSKTAPKSLLESLTSDKVNQIISNRLDSVLEDSNVPPADASALGPSKLTRTEHFEPSSAVDVLMSHSAGVSSGSRLWSVAAYSESNPEENFYVEPLQPLIRSDTASVFDLDTMPCLQEVEDIKNAVNHQPPATPSQEDVCCSEFKAAAMQTDMLPSSCCSGFAGLQGSSFLSDTRVLLQSGASVPGHAAVLYTRWPLFRKMLSEAKPTSPSFITLDLQEHSPHLVQQLMDYLYTGSHGPDYDEMVQVFFNTLQTLSFTVSTTVLSNELQGDMDVSESLGGTSGLTMTHNVPDDFFCAMDESTFENKSESHNDVIIDLSASCFSSALGIGPHGVNNVSKPSSLPYSFTDTELLDQSLPLPSAVSKPSPSHETASSVSCSTAENNRPATDVRLTQSLPQLSSPGGNIESLAADEWLLLPVLPHLSAACPTSQVSEEELTGEVVSSSAEDGESDSVSNSGDSLADVRLSQDWLDFSLDCPQVDYLLSPMTLTYEQSAVQGLSVAAGTPLTSRITAPRSRDTPQQPPLAGTGDIIQGGSTPPDHHMMSCDIIRGGFTPPDHHMMSGDIIRGGSTPPDHHMMSAVTPGGLASSDAVTPMPDYRNMATPWLKGQMSKFGVRSLSKKKMIAKLIEIYEYLHPIIEDRSSSDVPDSAPAQSTDVDPMAGPGGKRKGRRNKKAEVDLCTCQNASAKDSTDIHTRIFHCIMNCEELYRDIILYKTVDLAEFRECLNQQGIKIANPKLMAYLDKQAATCTTVVAGMGWLLFVIGMGLFRDRGAGSELLGLNYAYYWGMAVGSPFSLIALLLHPFIIDLVKNLLVKIFWTFGFVVFLVWHFVFAGVVLSTASITIFDTNNLEGALTANDLGLIFTGALGSVIFAGVSTAILYARDFVQVEEVKYD
uniref:Structure-specific endonuclease subunit SLX4 n=1 Tax=Halisarca dujardinii TaxID=2583056 RepID=A0AA96MLT9_HALDU|nr:structure-specific endonuclease subunit SLX4-like protein [Halisarca dujardinii]